MIKKEEFKKILLKDDIIEYFHSLEKDEIIEQYGEDIFRMYNYDQKNSWHCYNLLDHSLHAVLGITLENNTLEQYMNLKAAAFFHDIGKPNVAKLNPKTNELSFHGHPIESAKIAVPILKNVGYDEEEINKIVFYIKHHDDFMSFRIEKVKDSDIEINPENIANRIKNNNEAIDSYEYKTLLTLCRADSNAQSEYVIRNGELIGSREKSIQNINKIEEMFDDAMQILNNDFKIMKF